MVKLIIVRHAKTAWNKAGKIQGRSDIPLLPESVTLAKELGKTLSGENIDRVFSSPLVRAVETARSIVEGRNLPVEQDERLFERDFGAFDGKTYEQLGLEDHTKLFFSLSDEVGAESCQSVFDRTRSFVEYLKKECDGKTVLIVSHGVCISFIVYALTHGEWNTAEYEMSYIPNLTALRFTLGE